MSHLTEGKSLPRLGEGWKEFCPPLPVAILQWVCFTSDFGFVFSLCYQSKAICTHPIPSGSALPCFGKHRAFSKFFLGKVIDLGYLGRHSNHLKFENTKNAILVSVNVIRFGLESSLQRLNLGASGRQRKVLL